MMMIIIQVYYTVNKTVLQNLYLNCVRRCVKWTPAQILRRMQVLGGQTPAARSDYGHNVSNTPSLIDSVQLMICCFQTVHH